MNMKTVWNLLVEEIMISKSKYWSIKKMLATLCLCLYVYIRTNIGRHDKTG